MWWKDKRSSKYYISFNKEKKLYSFYNKKKFIQEVKSTRNLTDYHKQQIVQAIKQGLGNYLSSDWKAFQDHKMSSQKLIQNVNKTLVEKEISDQNLLFSSTDDLFTNY